MRCQYRFKKVLNIVLIHYIVHFSPLKCWSSKDSRKYNRKPDPINLVVHVNNIEHFNICSRLA